MQDAIPALAFTGLSEAWFGTLRRRRKKSEQEESSPYVQWRKNVKRWAHALAIKYILAINAPVIRRHTRAPHENRPQLWRFNTINSWTGADSFFPLTCCRISNDLTGDRGLWGCSEASFPVINSTFPPQQSTAYKGSSTQLHSWFCVYH